MGIFGGILIVPLYTQLQLAVPDEKRSAFIASNIMNALFMVSAAVFSMILFAIKLNIKEIFLIVSCLNFIFFACYIYRNPRDFYLAFFELLIKIIYKVEVKGAENFQDRPCHHRVKPHLFYRSPYFMCMCQQGAHFYYGSSIL